MDFSFTEDQELLRNSVREFAERIISSNLDEMIRTRRIPKKIMDGMRSMNLFGVSTPQKFGGMGASPVDMGIIAEEIGRADPTASISVLYLVHNSWSYLVSKHGTELLKSSTLPKIATGRSLTGIATTEPSCGSDIGSIKTTARRKNSSYIINGEKSFISLVYDIKENGGGFVTSAKTDPSKGTSGISLFYIPFSDEIEVSKLEEMGREGSTWGSLRFNELEVPSEYLLGERDHGFKIIHEGFELARAIIAVTSAATALRALDDGMDYMKERRAFGTPIGRFEGLQFQLADNVARMEAALTLGYKALWMYGEEQAERKFDRFQVTKEVAMAKLLSTVWAFDAINDSLQWHGAYGYTKNNPQEIALRAIRSFQLAEGSREVMKLIIARESLGKEFFKGK